MTDSDPQPDDAPAPAADLPLEGGTPVCPKHGPRYETYCTICAEEQRRSAPAAAGPSEEQMQQWLEMVKHRGPSTQQWLGRTVTSVLIAALAAERAALRAREDEVAALRGVLREAADALSVSVAFIRREYGPGAPVGLQQDVLNRVVPALAAARAREGEGKHG